MGGGSSSEKKQEDAEEFLRANARLREQQDHLESAKVMDDKPQQQERHDMTCPQLDAKSFRPKRRISSFTESTASQEVGMFRAITRRVSSLFLPLAPDCSDKDLPSWDPQTPFCYPVKHIPAQAKIPTRLTLADFTNVVHLADGSNANCYTALYNGQKVVIKMIKQAKERNDVTDHEFLHEHGMLARLDHPNIVKVLFLLIYLAPQVFVTHHTFMRVVVFLRSSARACLPGASWSWSTWPAAPWPLCWPRTTLPSTTRWCGCGNWRRRSTTCIASTRAPPLSTAT